jgi:hypothetical protein
MAHVEEVHVVHAGGWSHRLVVIVSFISNQMESKMLPSIAAHTLCLVFSCVRVSVTAGQGWSSPKSRKTTLLRRGS